jgi:hypothetical protein
MKLDLLHLTSVGDQKQIFGGIGQDHVQKAAANNRYKANQSTLDAEQAYNALSHIVPAAMLFAVLGHWPYSYYMLLP